MSELTFTRQPLPWELASQKSERERRFPWENLRYGDDRFAAQEEVWKFYADAGLLVKPRTAWASSPASMFGASQMLKQIAVTMKSGFINAMVPHNGVDRIEVEQKRTLLEGIIDPGITASTGAPVGKMFKWRRLESAPIPYKALDDLRRLLPSILVAERLQGDKSATPATFRDAVEYPALMYECIGGHLAANAFAILPFVKICFLCLPPVSLETWEFGNLKSATWSDGFTVTAKEPVQPLALEDGVLTLEGGTKALPAPEDAG